MADIFIGYASEDRARVEPLARALRDQGWSVFWDREIPPGSTWRKVLDRELSPAKCIAVIWTRTSVSNDWVIEEAEEGKSREVLIPVLMDQPDQAKIPRGFRGIQCADLTQWKGGAEEEGFQQLIGSVSRLAGPPPVAQQKVDQEKQTPVEQEPPRPAQRGSELHERKRPDLFSSIWKFQNDHPVLTVIGGVAIGVLLLIRLSVLESKQMSQEIIGKDGAPMVLVPEGEFLYGGNNQRMLLPAFYMDKYEVSTKLYDTFIQDTRRAQPADWSQQVALVGSGDRPVVNVTWHDADAYCRHYGKRLRRNRSGRKPRGGRMGGSIPGAMKSPAASMPCLTPDGTATGPWPQWRATRRARVPTASTTWPAMSGSGRVPITTTLTKTRWFAGVRGSATRAGCDPRSGTTGTLRAGTTLRGFDAPRTPADPVLCFLCS